MAAIADTSSRSFKSLIGPKPVIAMLSHSTKGSAKHALVDKVVEATRIAHEEYPHLTLDGELQLDAALVPSVAKSKAPGSSVNGHANVLIFPNLDAGNIGYKLYRDWVAQKLTVLCYRVSQSLLTICPEDVPGRISLVS